LTEEHVNLLESVEKKSVKAILDKGHDVLMSNKKKELIFYVSYHPKVFFEKALGAIISTILFSIGTSTSTSATLMLLSRRISFASRLSSTTSRMLLTITRLRSFVVR
jgi:hypothetical protein